MEASSGRFLVTRLMPGQELTEGLAAMLAASGAEAMAIATCVGSLTQAPLRHAGRDAAVVHPGPLEIVGLVGTVDPGHGHLHLTVADSDGAVRGGHLMPGARVRTTAEVVAVALDELTFDRAPCPVSGWRELVVSRR